MIRAAIYALSLVLVLYGGGLGQSRAKLCKSDIKGGKYKTISIDSLSTEPASYLGLVLVNPKDVNADYLTLLAKRLKSQYCGARHLQVMIVDEKRYGTWSIMRDYVDSKGKTQLMRGFYTFDRTTGEDKLEFSMKPGNRTTEVQIDLAKPLK